MNPEEDWSDLHAQTKVQLVREHIAMIQELEDLRGEIGRLRSVAEQLLEVVVIDPAALMYGLKRRRAIEAAYDARVIVPA